MDRPRFALDGMLGSLARWLRIMGYDSTYEGNIDDTVLLHRAAAEQRFLITRDKQLAFRAGDEGFLITSDLLEDQLSMMVQRFHLRFGETPSRCTVCNGELDLVPRDEVMDKVPPGALERHEMFFRCKNCGHIYWMGTHWDKIKRTMNSIHADRDQSL